MTMQRLPRIPLRACFAALALVLCAACERGGRGEDAAAGNGSAAPAAAGQAPAVDRQAPGSENRTPVLAGASGTLRYRPGCLYLDEGGGAETGLVLPADTSFDGTRLTGRLARPDGGPVTARIGEFANLSGRLIPNPGGGRYRCDTQMVLIADAF